MRTLSANVISEKEQDQTRPIELYDIYLGSQTAVDDDTLFICVHSERLNFWDMEDTPQVYVPLGIKRSPVKRNMDLAVDYYNATLDNVDRAMAALIAGVDFRNKRIVLRSLFLDQMDSSADATTLFDGIIDKPTITEFSLTVQVVSRLNLRKKTGRLYQLMCSWRFGGTYCGFDRDSTKVSGIVTADSTTSIIKDTSRSEAADYFKYGVIHFTSGLNNNIKRHITAYSTPNITIDIVLEHTPAVGDTYDIYQGCDKTLAWCYSAFNNRANFGGFHTIPVENSENP